MSVYKKKGSPYFHYDFVWKGQRYSGTTGLETKRQAEAYEARIRSDAILSIRKLQPITVDEATGLYAEHAETLPSWKTIRYILRELVVGLGKGKLLSEVTQRDLQTYFAKRRADLSNASVNREIENARAVWNRVKSAKIYDFGDMPEWASLLLKVPTRPPRELSTVEEPKLFEHLRADLIDVCDFALKSGWRLSEVLGLRWSDCDFTTRQASTRIKGGNTIKRPLTPTLIALIANQPKVGPMVFTYICQKSRVGSLDRKTGRMKPGRIAGQRYPVTPTALRGPWAAAKIAGNIEAFRFHDLRHTRGTRIVRATGSLAAAKEALKHTNLKTTLRYAHVLDDDVRHALDASESRTIPEAAEKPAKSSKKTAS